MNEQEIGLLQALLEQAQGYKQPDSQWRPTDRWTPSAASSLAQQQSAQARMGSAQSMQQMQPLQGLGQATPMQDLSGWGDMSKTQQKEATERGLGNLGSLFGK